jgi:predicted metal-dependent hydrolase
LSLGSFPATILVRQSARAQRLRIIVKPEQVELVVPRGLSERDALRFLEQHRAWVLVKLGEAKKRQQQAPERPSLISEEGTLPFQGQSLPVSIGRSGTSRVKARLHLLEGFEFLMPDGKAPDEKDLKVLLFAAVRPWLEQETRRQIEVMGFPEGLRPRFVRFKSMRSRWGSCGPQGDINLNWILALMPPPMLEYVIFHELCHLRHRNHSQAFWDLVETGIPDWRKRRDWLKKEGGRWVSRFG